MTIASGNCLAGDAAAGGSPRIVNVINLIRQCEPRIEWITEDVLFDTVVKQVEILKKHQLKGSFLLQYDALMDARYQKLFKELPSDLFEIGAWWEIPQPLVENNGYKWRGRYPWDWHADVGFATGYAPEEREKLTDTYMADFKKIFGRYPKSVGSWFIDAHTLEYMHDRYGIVASCNCKDRIGTDGYTMWGGYWNQGYYPSRKNAYMPAQHAANHGSRRFFPPGTGNPSGHRPFQKPPCHRHRVPSGGKPHRDTGNATPAAWPLKGPEREQRQLHFVEMPHLTPFIEMRHLTPFTMQSLDFLTGPAFG